MKHSLLAALVALTCACGGAGVGVGGSTVQPAPASASSTAPAHGVSSEHREMIAIMDRFLADAGDGDGATILRFVGRSPAVLVVYDQRLVPTGKALPDGTGPLLLAGFAAGSARGQLASGVNRHSPLDGVRGMLAVYRLLEARNPAVAISSLDELVARDAAGSLAAAVAERLARPSDSPTGAQTDLGSAGLGAFARLASTDTFADDAVGYAGLPSDNVVAFRILLTERSAGDAFGRLFREAGPAGQLYALAGLWHTDRAAFTQAAARLARSTANVAVQFGCSGLSLPVARLVDGGRTAVRIAPGETLTDALKARGSGELDMVGGGYPVVFAAKGYRASRP